MREIWNRKQWAGLATREPTQEAVDLLTDLNWLRAIDLVTGGRPKTTYEINPKVRAQ